MKRLLAAALLAALLCGAAARRRALADDEEPPEDTTEPSDDEGDAGQAAGVQSTNNPCNHKSDRCLSDSDQDFCYHVRTAADCGGGLGRFLEVCCRS